MPYRLADRATEICRRAKWLTLIDFFLSGRRDQVRRGHETELAASRGSSRLEARCETARSTLCYALQINACYAPKRWLSVGTESVGSVCVDGRQINAYLSGGLRAIIRPWNWEHLAWLR